MTNERKPDHRLAAIMATDVVGYSSLMQSDEAKALSALATIRQVTTDQIKQHRGRIANTAGDSVLAEFGSAVEAVRCALGLQEALSNKDEVGGLQVRIGIHLGDKGGDLFGTAVNVAARLEGIAQPGGIVVSAAVRDAIAGKLPTSFTDLGLRTLKNIEEPLRAFALSPLTGSLSPGAPQVREALPLPNKPSIAVLPFDDLSANRDQEYFADGVAEEIITALSRFPRLFVIARNSSFAYRGRSLDVKQIGRELGVRYILEGSVRKAGARVRITGILYAGTQPLIAKFRLIDASTGAHLWADRFDGNLEDIFDLQDHVTASVVGAIAPKLEQAEIERSRRKPTESLDAYDFYLRGLAGAHQWTKESTAEALNHFYQAIELDPHFAAAYGMAARVYALRRAGGWLRWSDVEVIAEVARLARRAAELGRDDAIALGAAGWTLAYLVGDHDHGMRLTDRAIALNPNLAWAWLFSGWVKLWVGEPEAAIERLGRALRLNPNDPHSYSMYLAMAQAHLFIGRHDEAVSWAQRAVEEKPKFPFASIVAAACYALAGQAAEAQRAIRRVLQLDPTWSVSTFHKRSIPVRQPQHVSKLTEGLRLAGLPE